MRQLKQVSLHTTRRAYKSVVQCMSYVHTAQLYNECLHTVYSNNNKKMSKTNLVHTVHLSRVSIECMFIQVLVPVLYSEYSDYSTTGGLPVELLYNVIICNI